MEANDSKAKVTKQKKTNDPKIWPSTTTKTGEKDFEINDREP